jgi:hypothetical protein
MKRPGLSGRFHFSGDQNLIPFKLNVFCEVPQLFCGILPDMLQVRIYSNQAPPAKLAGRNPDPLQVAIKIRLPHALQ